MYKKSQISGVDKESFLKKFGTFFAEFKSGDSQCFYYVIFVARRIVIAVLILFVEAPILQLVLSSVFSCSVKNI